MTLSPSSVEDLHWEAVTLPSAFNVMQHSEYGIVLIII